MELPQYVRRYAEELIGKYCHGRVPEHLKERVRHLYKVKGNTITILEERPHFMRPLLWTLSPIAQFRYTSSSKVWTLYCRDGNLKWWQFKPENPSTNLSDLINAVERDDTNIFWG